MGLSICRVRAVLNQRFPRSVQHRLAIVFAAVAGCFLLAGAFEGRQPEPHRETPAAADFDYYVLSLSWAPAFCAQEGANRGDRECDANRHAGFVVHGLWPQRASSGSSPEYCANVHPLPHSIVEDMLSIMPDRSLIQHEWRAHGSCSGMLPRQYFSTLRRAYAKVRVPGEFLSLKHPASLSPAEIERRFESASGFDSVPAVRVACRQHEFTEVRVCLSKDLRPIPCTPNVRGCSLPRVTVRSMP